MDNWNSEMQNDTDMTQIWYVTHSIISNEGVKQERMLRYEIQHIMIKILESSAFRIMAMVGCEGWGLLFKIKIHEPSKNRGWLWGWGGVWLMLCCVDVREMTVFRCNGISSTGPCANNEMNRKMNAMNRGKKNDFKTLAPFFLFHLWQFIFFISFNYPIYIFSQQCTVFPQILLDTKSIVVQVYYYWTVG